MTWAEFQIRLFSYRRQELEKMRQLRLLMFNNVKAPHMNPKKIPTKIEQFMNLGEKPKRLTDFQMQTLMKAQKKYNERT